MNDRPNCHICGLTVVPVDETVRYPSCECHIEIVRLREATDNSLIKALRSDVYSARANFEQSKNGNRAMYDQAFNRLTKAINKLNEVQVRKIKELGLETI